MALLWDLSLHLSLRLTISASVSLSLFVSSHMFLYLLFFLHNSPPNIFKLHSLLSCPSLLPPQPPPLLPKCSSEQSPSTSPSCLSSSISGPQASGHSLCPVLQSQHTLPDPCHPCLSTLCPGPATWRVRAARGLAWLRAWTPGSVECPSPGALLGCYAACPASTWPVMQCPTGVGWRQDT